MKIIENLKEKFNNIKNKESNHFKNSDFDLEFISKIQPAGKIILKKAMDSKLVLKYMIILKL